MSIFEPQGSNRIAYIVERLMPVVATTCWRDKGDQETIRGIRHVSSVPIWIVSGRDEGVIAAEVSDAQFIISTALPDWPQHLRGTIHRHLVAP